MRLAYLRNINVARVARTHVDHAYRQIAARLILVARGSASTENIWTAER
jgi:hypothetical protein